MGVACLQGSNEHRNYYQRLLVNNLIKQNLQTFINFFGGGGDTGKMLNASNNNSYI